MTDKPSDPLSDRYKDRLRLRTRSIAYAKTLGGRCEQYHLERLIDTYVWRPVHDGLRDELRSGQILRQIAEAWWRAEHPQHMVWAGFFADLPGLSDEEIMARLLDAWTDEGGPPAITKDTVPLAVLLAIAMNLIRRGKDPPTWDQLLK